jgi:hypothetical protein
MAVMHGPIGGERRRRGSIGRNSTQPRWPGNSIAMLARDTDMRVRLTSLNPLNPDNSPEDWERLALASFNQGTPEYIDHLEGGGQHLYRYMAPLKTLNYMPALPCRPGLQGGRCARRHEHHPGCAPTS